MTRSSTSDAPAATATTTNNHNNSNGGGRNCSNDNDNDKKKRKKKWMSIALLHSALVFVQIGTSGYQVITRIALTSGMNLFVFAVYRGAIGLCFLIPIAFFAERNTRPPLTWALLGHFFLLGLTGVFLSQALYLEGLSYTSPTFAAAIQNSIPAITFIIAAAFGQEKVRMKSIHGQAKIAGTLTCVAGATVMVFYSGPAIIQVASWWGPHAHAHAHGSTNTSQHLDAVQSWQIGALFLVGMCIAFSFWLVIQKPVVALYPARLSITAMMTLFGTVQLLVLALFRVRDPSEWVFTWGYELFSVFYAGIVVSGLVFSVQMWCVQRGSALLTAVYQPAQTLIVAILTLLFLRESFYLGSLIGGSLIIVGVYLVIWGQGGDPKAFHSSRQQEEQEQEQEEQEEQEHQYIKIDASSTTNLDSSDQDHTQGPHNPNYIPETIRNYTSFSSRHGPPPTAKDRFIFSGTSQDIAAAITQPLLAATTTNAVVFMDSDQTT